MSRFARSYPVKSRDGAWAWRLRIGWRSYLDGIAWLFVPGAVQRWWVERENLRFCATRGHDDTLWHMAEDDIVPSTEARCGNCSVNLDRCTGYGFTHQAVAASDGKVEGA